MIVNNLKYGLIFFDIDDIDDLMIEWLFKVCDKYLENIIILCWI